jgi:DUF1365 family protein
MSGASCLYDAVVVHQRTRPVKHRLQYRISTLLLDLDELPALGRRLRLFAYNRPGVVSFHERDHGAGERTGLRAWVEAQMRAAGMTPDGGPIRLLAMPRVLGHVFNPLSVFFCHRRDGVLIAVLYEVNNTFGQRHSYLFPVTTDGRPLVQGCDKAFYVSPFLPMDMRYRFNLVPPDAGVSVGVFGDDAEGLLIAATLVGQRRTLTDAALLATVLRMQLLSAKVVAGIHWEALKLWRKGLRLVHRPPPPPHPVTIGH